MQFNYSYLLCDDICAWCCTAALWNRKMRNESQSRQSYATFYAERIFYSRNSCKCLAIYMPSPLVTQIHSLIEIAARRNLRHATNIAKLYYVNFFKLILTPSVTIVPKITLSVFCNFVSLLYIQMFPVNLASIFLSI